MFRHDLREGIIKRTFLFALPVCLILINVMRAGDTFARIAENFGKEPTLGMYLLNAFAGCLPASVVGKDFSLPMGWMLILIGCLFSTVTYPSKDLESECGMQVMIRGRSRVRWWLSKCVWNLASVFIFFGILFLTAVVFCVCTKASLSMELNYDEALHLISNADMMPEGIPGWKVAALTIGLPALTTAALCIWQMFISILWHPVYGFGAGVAVLIWSAYSQTPFAIGNYAMMQRLDIFCMSGMPVSSAWIVPVFLLAGVMAGCLVMKRRDILKLIRIGD